MLYKQLDYSAHHLSLFIFNVILHTVEGKGGETVGGKRRKSSFKLPAHFIRVDCAYKYSDSKALITAPG